MAFRVIPVSQPRQQGLTEIATGLLQALGTGAQARRGIETGRLAAEKTKAETAKLNREATGVLTPAQQIQRAKFQQQFGVDAITGEPIPPERLFEPRFGFGAGDELREIENEAARRLRLERQGGAAAPSPQPGGVPPQTGLPRREVPEHLRPDARVTVPQQGAQFVDPEATNAIRLIMESSLPDDEKALRVAEVRRRSGF